MRYYDPGTGRYITSDPLGLNSGLNLYGYVSGNPLRYVDIYGLFQFGDVALGDSNIMGPHSDSNIGVYHEHGFYQDGTGDNVGFFKTNGPFGGDGRVGRDPGYPGNKEKYVMYPEVYDDDVMRKAQNIVDPGEYDLIKNNCQDYADKLRNTYDRIQRESLGLEAFHPWRRNTNNVPAYLQ
jgi:uncharacterized protein RhaS with RHS repeats